MSCPACGGDVADAARFCPSCGSPVDRDSGSALGPEAPTHRAPGSPGDAPHHRGPSPGGRASSSSDSLDGARFVPGTVLENRYRIVAMAGRGGMGEVYRAEDLKLSQTVALKFLPEPITQDGAALARFHREVRIARQVSHANVCRVFDIGEADGMPFLTMEYVDGEDLATLLRRIGRLPSDKAIEVARQICAGLAAAHEGSVIHRDLKPANVMIDGRGKVRLTDFGLAGAAGSFKTDEFRAGTPAYMAPEQLAGKDASVQSDIYALGLVLYEVFTGKRPFEATTLAELRRAQEQSVPTNPSLLVTDINPLVGRVILRCLDRDPTKRPPSALQVAAALPGGDPLAAALAAGETPSPEMVAASGESEGLRPAVAWTVLAGVAVSVIAAVLLSAQTKLYRRVSLEQPPEALAERARNILRSVGYAEPPVDTSMGFYQGNEFLRYIAEHDQSNTRWDHLETGAFVFWYRGSPRPLAVQAFASDAPMQGAVWTDDPPLDVSGMTLVQLNPLGRLTEFVALPPQIEEPSGVASSLDWGPLFSAAGLDPSKWLPAQPTWTPPSYGDARAAWTGSLAERPTIPMRIEAAAYRGKPVYFELIGPWTRPERMQPYQATSGERAVLAIGLVLFPSLLVATAMLARRNLRLGRGDRRGAFRLASFVFACLSVAWLFGAHHVPSAAEFGLFTEFLVRAIAVPSLSWVLYIAMEPYVRRRWPVTLVSWSRLLAGGLRDPLVGRDVLLGCFFGAFSIALVRLAWFVPGWLGYPPPQPYSGPEWQLLGARTMIAYISNDLIGAPVFWTAALFVLFLLRVLLRKEWAAVIVWVLVYTVFRPPTVDLFAPVVFVTGLINMSLTVWLMIRFGLLAVVASEVMNNILGSFPFTTQGSAWYSSLSLAGILLTAAIACYGFYTSLGGRAVFGTAVLEE
jgi:hypothetical protein